MLDVDSNANAALLKTLNHLQADPSLSVVLYKQLFNGVFYTIVKNPGDDASDFQYLMYPTADNKYELPVFTSMEHELLHDLVDQAENVVIIETSGNFLWPDIKPILADNDVFIAVDPGKNYAIRLTREIVLGMLINYTN